MNEEFNKYRYQAIKKAAKAYDIKAYSYPEYNLTIAVSLENMFKGRVMLPVSVSYCAREDKFKKKVGKFQAMSKMLDGEYVQLPIVDLYVDYKDMGDTNKQIFNKIAATFYSFAAL